MLKTERLNSKYLQKNYYLEMIDKEAINRSSRENRVSITWIPGHIEVEGNCHHRLP